MFLSRTGIGPKPETASAMFTTVIWLAGPWHDWDFAVTTSMAEQMSGTASPAGIVTVVPPKDNLGAVVEGYLWTKLKSYFEAIDVALNVDDRIDSLMGNIPHLVVDRLR